MIKVSLLFATHTVNYLLVLCKHIRDNCFSILQLIPRDIEGRINIHYVTFIFIIVDQYLAQYF